MLTVFSTGQCLRQSRPHPVGGGWQLHPWRLESYRTFGWTSADRSLTGVPAGALGNGFGWEEAAKTSLMWFSLAWDGEVVATVVMKQRCSLVASTTSALRNLRS